ncbi:hypothetical protein LshimejAT787_0602400 [Lyophyllum shimeji]|uniref:BTB domain-containing protein n=1 Tax=Lyophyllum shimeji TaxID=47721 RepID=A0A9P3PPA6_LYOSH|nr:hypothetical protein LshimejAT787_0602400 [Lyophyllum shimeji]
MEQAKPDLWSLDANTSSITSFFALPLKDGHSPSIGKGHHYRRKSHWNAGGPVSISLPTSLPRIPLASYFSIDSDFTGTATVAIKVEFRSSLTVQSISEPPTRKLQEALCNSLAGDAFGDAKSCLFARRVGKGHVTRPQVIFANKSLLQGHSAPLDKLLDAVENIVTVRDLAYVSRGDMYEYDSDSDLESEPEEGDGDPNDHNDCAIGAAVTIQGKEKAAHGITELGENERVIFIRDAAFKTWKSLVFYLYTGEVNFRRSSSDVPQPGLEPNTPAPCSPKSIYRLAIKFDLPELKLLALNAIARDLSEGNIVNELFSRFTSMYAEVQKLEAVVAGNLPHCFSVLDAIMREMKLRGASDEPKSSSPPTARPPSCLDGPVEDIPTAGIPDDSGSMQSEMLPKAASGLGGRKKKAVIKKPDPNPCPEPAVVWM